MILNNVKPVDSNTPINIKIDGGKIAKLFPLPIVDAGILQIDLHNALIFPGLINSHDHLDFNLFPQLGKNHYNNYTEWGKYIHERYKTEITAVLKIPVELRYKWGIYKNLLCGVTTVIDHSETIGTSNDLITVFKDSQVIHSVGFEKHWKLKLNNPLNIHLPVNIHVGEGIDPQSNKEISQLLNWNILSKKLIGVHAVGMTENQAEKFEAIVWCPQSNYFLLGKTALIDVLKKHTNILFGTDSTLTSEWDIWEHLRSARNTKLLTNAELYNAITINAAKTWRLNSGQIAQGKDADLVIAKKTDNKAGFDAFYEVTPADFLLIVHQGEITLFDEELSGQLGEIENNFSKIQIDGVFKYVKGDLPGLMAEIRKHNPNANFPKNVTANIDNF